MKSYTGRYIYICVASFVDSCGRRGSGKRGTTNGPTAPVAAGAAPCYSLYSLTVIMGNKVSLEDEMINLRIVAKQMQRSAKKCEKNEKAALEKLKKVRTCVHDG
jgi:hypothetical protein